MSGYREGWQARRPDADDDWEPIPGKHADHEDAAETWADHAWREWMWESGPGPHAVDVRSPDGGVAGGEVKALEITVDFDPSFTATTRRAR